MSEQNDETKLKLSLMKNIEGKQFRLNPDVGIVDRVIKAMIKRKEKYTEYYCPCRLPSGDKEKDKSIICPCIYHEEEIARDGYYHCHLYVK